MDAVAELGRNPVSKHQIQPECGDEQADGGRDCRTRLARPNSQARTRTGNICFPCSADHEQDWQPDPVNTYVTIHIHIYTSSGQYRVYRVTQGRIDGVHCRKSVGTGPVVLKVFQ